MSAVIRRSLLVTILFLLVSCHPSTIAPHRESATQTPSPVAVKTVQTDKLNSDLWAPVDNVVKADARVENTVEALLSTMTVAQKVAQMIQPEIRDISVADMRRYGFGSYLNGGGSFPNGNKHATPQDWIQLAEDMYQASIDDSVDGSSIPTMWGTDAVHGHNNVIGATLFPHNIGLGAANNPDLIKKIASVTATEVMVTGIDWVFAPTVATVRNDRWGRTYEGYSEDPAIVKAYARSIVTGLQGQVGKDFLGDSRVISTVKHFVGDGGTEEGDDQGNTIVSESELYHIHAQGYVSGLAAGAQSVMASFNRWQGDKIHGNKYLLTEVLKQRMGFDGFVVGDWNGHGQVAGCTNESCSQAINAGLDIFMVPTGAWKPLFHNTVAQVNEGIIPMSRVDDAVRRILRVKVRADLFNKPSPKNRPVSGKTELIGQVVHRNVAKQAVRESLVLLKNNNDVLPVKPKQRILVAGDAANNIGKQSGGWTITWQGTNNSNSDFPGGSSIYDGIKAKVLAAGGAIELAENGDYQDKPDVAIVVFGEEPYAEGQGDIEHLDYQPNNPADLALLKRLKAAGIPVVSVFITGRPMWINPELNASDAFVVAWLPGSEGDAVSDVLLSNVEGNIAYDFKGRLSFSWPNQPSQTTVNKGDKDYRPLFPYGYGLDYQQTTTVKVVTESVTDSSTANDAFVLHNGGVKWPFKMQLVANDAVEEITSSSTAVDGIAFRTLDRFIQEDAFQLLFNSDKASELQFLNTDSRSPSISTGQQAYVVSMSVKPLAPVSGTLALSVDCFLPKGQAENCKRTIDITPLVVDTETNQWRDIEVELGCVQNNYNAPLIKALAILSDSVNQLAVHNIVLRPSVKSLACNAN